MKQDALGKPSKRAATRIVLSGVRSAFIGPNLEVDTYRTPVATIVIGLDTDVALTTPEDPGSTSSEQPLLVVAPGTHCQVKAEGSVAFLYCDALNDDHTEIDLRGMERKLQGLRKLLRRGPADQTPTDFLNQAFQQIGVDAEPNPRPDMAKIVDAIGRAPENFASVELAAEFVGLSPTRFQHVFTESVGMPFRRYRQWRRMGRVVRELAAGQTLTQAAYAAGFANSAHLSTAFKAMFGLRPSELISRQAEYYLAEYPSDL